MFKKILIAEDRDIINAGFAQVFADLNIDNSSHARYCDEAFLKIQKALNDNAPYDLLISDLSFIPDEKTNRLTSGDELIAAVRKIQPDIKIIAFSIEDRAYIIKSLFDKHDISGYVFKGRHSISELKKAMQSVFRGEKFMSAELSHVTADKTTSEIDDYDIELLKLLAQGLKQEEISKQFQKNGTTPFSVSAIEKRISRLKINFRANNNVQIVVKAIELGLLLPN